MAPVRPGHSPADQAEQSESSSAQRLQFRHFLVLVVVSVVVGSAVLGVASLHVLPTTGDTMYPETANILPGIALLHSGQVYPDFNAYPFFASVYGPLFYLFIAVIARIAHSNLFAILIVGRAVSYLCFLATGLLVYLCARRLGYPRSYAAIAWLGVAFCADFFSWNVTFRPDVPALMFGAVALYLALRSETGSRLNLGAAGLCAAAAVLLKQSIFMATLAIAIWLITSKRFRDLAVFVASVALPVIALFAFLQTREPALQRVMALRYTPKDVPSAITIVRHALLRADGALLMTFALIAVFFAAHRRHRLLLIYFICAWTLPVLALAQCGANANYLLEGWLACALLIPAALTAIEDRWPRLHFAWRAALILGLVAVLAGQIGLWKYFTASRMPTKFANVAPLRDLKVFGDVPYLTGSGREPELPEPFLAHMFAITGHWSPAPVAARIDQRIYDVIILGNDRGFVRGWRGVTNLDPVLLNRINADYNVLCGTGQFVVLIPNSRIVPFNTALANEVFGRPCTAPASKNLSSVLRFEPYRSR